jgi:hypothetical protein
VRLGYRIPLNVAHCAQKNKIQGRSHTDDSGQLVTSNSNITRVIEYAKDLVTNEKAGKFKSHHQKDQLSTTLKTEEHRVCIRAISSITSWKEGFTKDIRMYKKFGRHNKDAGSANNDEEQFATQLFIS